MTLPQRESRRGGGHGKKKEEVKGLSIFNLSVERRKRKKKENGQFLCLNRRGGKRGGKVKRRDSYINLQKTRKGEGSSTIQKRSVGAARQIEKKGGRSSRRRGKEDRKSLKLRWGKYVDPKGIVLRRRGVEDLVRRGKGRMGGGRVASSTSEIKGKKAKAKKKEGRRHANFK